jgi:predicted metalloprotease with PDZ domain
MAVFIAFSPAWGQENAGEAVKDAVQQATDATKDAAKQAQDIAKQAQDTAKDATKQARDTAKEARDTARDATRDAREGARDTARDVREGARDVREGVRDTARDIRDSVRDARRTFRAESTRAADFGIWFGRSTDRGLVISDVATTGAISRVGFREGDSIVSVNGRRVASEADFVRQIFADDVRNTRVKVVVLRGGREEIVYVEPAVLIEEMYAERHDPLEDFGLVLDDRYTDRIVVWKVLPRSPAFYAGFRSGDVITTFQGRRIASPREFVQVVERTDPGWVAVDVTRGQRARSLEVDYRTGAEARTALRPNFEQGVERRTERREERREGREERREERREGAVERIEQPAVTPGTEVIPQPRPGSDRPSRPRLFPRRR